MKYEKHLRNTALGLLVGFGLAMFVTYTLDQEVWGKYEKYIVYLMSAGFSLFGATLALIGVFANLDRQNATEAGIRTRRLESARAFLPSALSQFSEICRFGIREKHGILPSGLIQKVFSISNMDGLFLSDEMTRIFRDVIENCNDIAVRKHLAEMLRQHQLLVARASVDTVFNSRAPTFDDYGNITHWAYLYALVGTLFPFARGESPSIKQQLVAHDIRAALSFLNVHVSAESYSQYEGHIATYQQEYEEKVIKKRPGHF